MQRQKTVIGIVGVLVGFVIGFFAGQLREPVFSDAAFSRGDGAIANHLPEDHPSPELMHQLEHWRQDALENPQDKRTRVSLANAYFDMQRFDAAIPWFEEALALDPVDINVVTDLATSYLYLGHVERSIELYQRSLELEPDHPQTLQNIGIAFFATRHYNEAVRYWDRLLSSHPEYPHAEQIRLQIEKAKAEMTKGDS